MSSPIRKSAPDPTCHRESGFPPRAPSTADEHVLPVNELVVARPADQNQRVGGVAARVEVVNSPSAWSSRRSGSGCGRGRCGGGGCARRLPGATRFGPGRQPRHPQGATRVARSCSGSRGARVSRAVAERGFSSKRRRAARSAREGATRVACRVSRAKGVAAPRSAARGGRAPDRSPEGQSSVCPLLDSGSGWAETGQFSWATTRTGAQVRSGRRGGQLASGAGATLAAAATIRRDRRRAHAQTHARGRKEEASRATCASRRTPSTFRCFPGGTCSTPRSAPAHTCSWTRSTSSTGP